MQDRLFLCDAVDHEMPGDDACLTSNQMNGCIAEHEAMIELMKRGHDVFQPRTDRGGIDFLVGIHPSIVVQVKSSSVFHNGAWLIGLSSKRSSERKQDESAAGCIRSCVDVLIVRVADVDGWWVIPRSALQATNAYGKQSIRLYMHPSGGRADNALLSSYRDRWDVFDYPDNFGVE